MIKVNYNIGSKPHSAEFKTESEFVEWIRNNYNNQIFEISGAANNDIEIYKSAITKYGEYAQIDMVIEEMAELTQALSKYKRGKSHNVEEEIADVEIMLEQMRLIFDSKKVDEIKQSKITRLDKRVKEGYTNVKSRTES